MEFDNPKKAENTFGALQTLWAKVDGEIIINPQIRILKLIESKDIQVSKLKKSGDLPTPAHPASPGSFFKDLVNIGNLTPA